jgi:cyclohexa-1,5-dienecarbonyl-CoA hydratase
MSYEHLTLKQTNGIARLTLSRPPLNVLNIAMMRELQEALAAVAADPQAKLLLISGAGRAFCAGVDIADHTADRVHEMIAVFHGAIRQILALELPVVAAVNGAALGGGLELALACDIVLAQEGAKLGLPEIQLAVFPPLAAALLPRLIGWQRSVELILGGQVFTADEGMRLGLVNQVWPAEHFTAQVTAFVERQTTLSSPVMRMAKRAMRAGLEQGAAAALAHAETLYLGDLMRLDDPQEGLVAFMEKRKPVWRDR